MELSSQISELQSKYSALSLVLSSICEKVAQMSQCCDICGTETFAKLIEFQTQVNSELLIIRTQIDEYYQKIDQIRQALMGSVVTPITTVATEEPIKILDLEFKDMASMIDQMKKDPELMKKIMEEMMKDPKMKQRMEEMMDMMDDEDIDEEDAARSTNPDDFLVVEDKEKPTTFHLQVKRNGKPDHNLMGAAWAALHSGFRGNKYEGPKKAEAIKKLKALYKKEKMPLPSGE